MIIRPTPGKPEPDAAGKDSTLRQGTEDGKPCQVLNDPRLKITLGVGILVAGVFLVMAAWSLIDALREPAGAAEPQETAKPAAPAPARRFVPPVRIAPMPPPVPRPAATPEAPKAGSGPYGDYKFRETLPDKQEAQYRMLMEEAHSQPTNQEERSSLALTPERAEQLKKSGNLVY